MPANFQKLAMHAPVGIYATDAKGRCTYVNPRLCELFGISRRTALGLGWLRSVHPEDLARMHRERRSAIASPALTRIEYRIQRGDGRVVWIAASSQPLFDARRRVVGRVGTVIDVTEQKRAEQLLHAQREKLQAAIEGSPFVMRALSSKGPLAVLSPQEWRIVAQVSEGRTNKQIARDLRLSEKTVRNYLSNVFEKLGVHRRTQAALLFAQLRGAEP